ncbi:hypothetical protein ACFLZC_00385 [Patescibacteria group bacterium]
MKTILNIIRPEFFDIFGIFVFTFFIILAIWGLKTKKPLPRWSLIILLLVGIAGIIVDGIIVYITYLQ